MGEGYNDSRRVSLIAIVVVAFTKGKMRIYESNPGMRNTWDGDRDDRAENEVKD